MVLEKAAEPPKDAARQRQLLANTTFCSSCWCDHRMPWDQWHPGDVGASVLESDIIHQHWHVLLFRKTLQGLPREATDSWMPQLDGEIHRGGTFHNFQSSNWWVLPAQLGPHSWAPKAHPGTPQWHHHTNISWAGTSRGWSICGNSNDIEQVGGPRPSTPPELFRGLGPPPQVPVKLPNKDWALDKHPCLSCPTKYQQVSSQGNSKMNF